MDITMMKNTCDFGEVFRHTHTVSHLSSVRPVSEATYSKSDFDGWRWWTTWFRCTKALLDSELAVEIDTFQEELFEMPEFASLEAMKALTGMAEATGDPTEFNLYAATEHFYIWIRIITRFRDENLYVHFYRKDLAGEMAKSGEPDVSRDEVKG